MIGWAIAQGAALWALHGLLPKGDAAVLWPLYAVVLAVPPTLQLLAAHRARRLLWVYAAALAMVFAAAAAYAGHASLGENRGRAAMALGVLLSCSWFVLLAAVTALLWWLDTASYDKLCLMMFSGMTLCLIIYMVLPNGLDIRPTAEAIGRENFAMTLMQLIWKADASVNVCPSIHCQSTACMAIAFSGSTLTKQRPWLKAAAWVWAALICASTVFTKQHSIIDVVCGLALAAVWGVILYGPWKKRQD